MLRTISLTESLTQSRLWLTMIGLIVVVVVVVVLTRSLLFRVVLLASWSKSCQKSRRIVKEPKKLQRSEKFTKGIGLEERLPKHRSSINEEVKLPLEFWQFFELRLHDPGTLSISFSKRLLTCQSKWSCWCSVVFFLRGARKIFESFTNRNQWSFCTKVCLQNARPPSAQILQMRSGRNRPSPESAWCLGGCWESGASPRALWHRENSRTCCQERALDLQSLPIPTHRWKVTSYDSILIVDRLKKILCDEPVQIPIDAPRLPDSIVSDWDSVFTSKFWFFWYHFQVRLRSPPMRLLREHWIEISRLHGLDIANPFPPDLSGYVHGFSYWFDLWIGYVWQISFRQTFEVTCMDLAINQRVW